MGAEKKITIKADGYFLDQKHEYEVDATVIGEFFAVHRRSDWDARNKVPVQYKKIWTATHIPTGMAVAETKSKRLAVAAVKAFLSLNIDWNFSEKSKVSSWPKTIRDKCYAIKDSAKQGMA